MKVLAVYTLTSLKRISQKVVCFLLFEDSLTNSADPDQTAPPDQIAPVGAF